MARLDDLISLIKEILSDPPIRSHEEVDMCPFCYRHKSYFGNPQIEHATDCWLNRAESAIKEITVYTCQEWDGYSWTLELICENFEIAKKYFENNFCNCRFEHFESSNGCNILCSKGLIIGSIAEKNIKIGKII